MSDEIAEELISMLESSERSIGIRLTGAALGRFSARLYCGLILSEGSQLTYRYATVLQAGLLADAIAWGYETQGKSVTVSGQALHESGEPGMQSLQLIAGHSLAMAQDSDSDDFVSDPTIQDPSALSQFRESLSEFLSVESLDRIYWEWAVSSTMRELGSRPSLIDDPAPIAQGLQFDEILQLRDFFKQFNDKETCSILVNGKNRFGVLMSNWARRDWEPVFEDDWVKNYRDPNKPYLEVDNLFRTYETPPDSLLGDLAIAMDEEDLLGFGKIADVLTGQILSPKTKTPLVIALNAPWGSGKSSLGNLIRRRLERRSELEIFNHWLAKTKYGRFLATRAQERYEGSLARRTSAILKAARGRDLRRRHHCMWFDAWMHDDSPDLVGSFSREVARAANNARSAVWQVFRPMGVRLTAPVINVMRIWAIALLGVYVWVAFRWALPYFDIALGYLPGSPQISNLANLGSAWSLGLTPVLAAVAVMAGEQIQKVFMEKFTTFIRDPEKSAEEGQINAVRKRIGSLMAQATSHGRRFVIFIDNIERCQPENSIAVLDLVNQLLTHPNVVVIVMGDMNHVSAAAGAKYKDQATLLGGSATEKEACLKYGREYLQKVIQLRVDVPTFDKEDLADFVEKAGKREVPTPPALSRWDKVLVAPVVFIDWVRDSFIRVFRRMLRRQEELTKAEEDVLAERAMSTGQVAKTAAAWGGADNERLEQRLNERIRIEVKVGKANREVMDYLVSSGTISLRKAKRYENSLRLHLKILVASEVDIEDIPSEVLGRWLFFRESWPEIVKSCQSDQGVLRALENASRSNDAAWKKAVSEYRAADEQVLREVLADAPALSGHFDQLSISKLLK